MILLVKLGMDNNVFIIIFISDSSKLILFSRELAYEMNRSKFVASRSPETR